MEVEGVGVGLEAKIEEVSGTIVLLGGCGVLVWILV